MPQIARASLVIGMSVSTYAILDGGEVDRKALEAYLARSEYVYDSDLHMVGARWHGPGYHSIVVTGTWAHLESECRSCRGVQGAISTRREGFLLDRRPSCDRKRGATAFIEFAPVAHAFLFETESLAKPHGMPYPPLLIPKRKEIRI